MGHSLHSTSAMQGISFPNGLTKRIKLVKICYILDHIDHCVLRKFFKNNLHSVQWSNMTQIMTYLYKFDVKIAWSNH